MNRFPIYIVSKGRHKTRHTVKSLLHMKVDFRIVVEEQERGDYASVIDEKHLLVLDPQYQQDYDTFDDLGQTKSVGPGAARNFVWDHSISRGAKWHWVMDDNIRWFFRLHENQKIRFGDGSPFWHMEEFCERYTNIAMAGPQYYMFAPRKDRVKPAVFNTRIYSCNLIRNDVPYRWRGRYNEDTDLSLRMLKDGWCTVQFNAFLQQKLHTQTIKGGNTEEFYAKEGTLNKSKMLIDMHPDVSSLVWKWNRWHHYVDYSPFRGNALKRRPRRRNRQPKPLKLVSLKDEAIRTCWTPKQRRLS